MVAIDMKAIPYLQFATVLTVLAACLFFGMSRAETVACVLVMALAIVLDNRINR